MIEYFLLMHKGGRPAYNDGVFPIANPELTIGIISAANLGENSESVVKVFKDTLGSEAESQGFDVLSDEVVKRLPDNAEFMILRISDTRIESLRRGRVYGKIVKAGELKMLPNGVFGLEDEDRIVCGNEEFFSHLQDEAIYADSMFAESSQEWMEYMVRRISDANWLSGNNLSAVTLIVRSGI